MADLDNQLREKIASKMTVATFLAGFTFAALLELLNDPAPPTSVPRRIALVSLTLALALFISAVYMYDRLTMPREYWRYDPSEIRGAEAILERLHFKVHQRRDMENDGARYTYMIGVWQWVFTPAVISAFVGFSAMLYNSGEHLIFWVGIALVVSVGVYHRIVRPILGKVD